MNLEKLPKVTPPIFGKEYKIKWEKTSDTWYQPKLVGAPKDLMLNVFSGKADKLLWVLRYDFEQLPLLSINMHIEVESYSLRQLSARMSRKIQLIHKKLIWLQSSGQPKTKRRATS